ncbi:MAG: ABC transporter permease [Candidatus Bathyarchaeia archaeon]
MKNVVNSYGIYFMLLVILLGSYSLLGFQNGTSLIILGIASMVPISLTAMGELLCERAGIFNVGVEGMMLLSSLFSVIGAKFLGHWMGGIAVGTFIGALLGLIFGLACTRWQGDQLLFGLGLNIISQGIVLLLLLKIFNTLTFYRVPSNMRIPQFRLANSTISGFALAGLVLAVVMYFVISNTRFGLRVRAVGQAPAVADYLGIDPYRVRTVAAVMCGIAAGISGAYMSLDWVGLASPTLIAGRGFMALACVKFGGLNPLRIFSGAMIFGILLAAANWLQNIPAFAFLTRQGGGYLLLALPYFFVVLTLSLFPYSEPLAKTIGVSYRRE